MNIFKEMALSIYSYKSYKEFLNNKKSKVFLFGVVLMLFYFILTIVAPFMKFMIPGGGIAKAIEENIPDFELQDGYLWVDDVIEFDEGDTYICIDTDPEFVFYDADEMEEYLYGYSQVILMDSEKFIVKSQGQVQGFYFSDLDSDFSKDDLIALVPSAYVIIAICMLFMYIWMTALFFFGVIIVALIGMIVASCMKCQLTFGQLYLLGVYSRTLPLIIKAVLSWLPISIPFFTIINFGISVIIIVMAIRNMGEQTLQQPLEFNSNNSNSSNGMNGNFSNFSDAGSADTTSSSTTSSPNDFSWMQ